MANIEKDNQYYEEFMSKAYDKIEREKEQRFVNLMVEIIVSMTLKEQYKEEDNQIERDQKE